MFNPGEVLVREFSAVYRALLKRGYVVVEHPDDKNVIMELRPCKSAAGTGKEN